MTAPHRDDVTVTIPVARLIGHLATEPGQRVYVQIGDAVVSLPADAVAVTRLYAPTRPSPGVNWDHSACGHSRDLAGRNACREVQRAAERGESA